MPNRMNRRDFINTTASGAAALALRSAAGASEPRRKPNVVFLFSDEHRWQAMSFAGMPQAKTPHMERMAAQGVSFDNCVSNYPVCSPYRAMLLTGRWPYQQGITDNALKLSSDEMTIGKAFKQAGYATGYIGKWHLGGTRAEPFGFDHSLIWSRTNSHWNSAYHPKDGKPVKCTRYNATAMADQALEFIDGNKDRPFFLMVSWNPPHSNFTDAPQEDKDLYPPGSLPYPPNVKQPKGLNPRRAERRAKRRWAVYNGYHAHVTAIDRELGRVMAKLDALGLANNTILVYTSDHGSLLGSHGAGGKRQPY